MTVLSSRPSRLVRNSSCRFILSYESEPALLSFSSCCKGVSKGEYCASQSDSLNMIFSPPSAMYSISPSPSTYRWASAFSAIAHPGPNLAEPMGNGAGTTVSFDGSLPNISCSIDISAASCMLRRSHTITVWLPGARSMKWQYSVGWFSAVLLGSSVLRGSSMDRPVMS
jgi:hypothetical protein